MSPTTMDWSPQQDDALKAVDAWLKNKDGPQLFRLFGYAGTGKTTLARHLAASVAGDVHFAAYTGKAAHVLRSMGCVNATTIHKLIYLPRPKSEEHLVKLKESLIQAKLEGRLDIAARIEGEIRAENMNLRKPAFVWNEESVVRYADLVVIDECSMVDEEMAQDLMSFGTKILVLGDPAQLPPIRGGGFFTECKPDKMLTEIHRQAKDNPIIHLATQVRQGVTLQIGDYGESKVTRNIDASEAMGVDQIIVGMNKTRHVINKRIRELNGYDREGHEYWPNIGERLVCLRNDKETGLMNGMIVTTTQPSEELGSRLKLFVRDSEETEGEMDVIAHKEFFIGAGEDMPYHERREALEFDYGYALTCHKSQGSQWGNILLFDEWFKEDTRKRWLYTAITRAQKRITIKR